MLTPTVTVVPTIPGERYFSLATGSRLVHLQQLGMEVTDRALVGNRSIAIP